MKKKIVFLTFMIIFSNDLLSQTENSFIQKQNPFFDLSASHLDSDKFTAVTGDLYLFLTENKEEEVVNVNNNEQVYPNPFIDFINIVCEDNIKSIKIYSVDGKLMYHDESQNNIVNLHFLKTGAYLIVINNKKTYKIIKL